MAKENLAPLVVKAQSGDKNALNDLLAQTYETLYYYAYNTVKNEDLAADITQESCEEIIKTIGNLRNPEAFKTWAGRIVAHQCTRYYRQTKDEVYLDENEDGETILDRLPDDSRGSLPEQVQEDKEFKKLMWQMLDKLPEEQRQALVLYYMDNLSVPQIAEIQGKPEGTIKSRLNYGRKAVIAQVNEYEKKHNIKLHSLAPLPLLLYFLFRENMAQVLADSASTLEKVWQNISGAVSATGAAAAAGTAAAGAAATGTAAGMTGAAAGSGAAAGAGIAAKIIAGVVAAVVTVGAVVGGIALTQKSPMADYEGQWTCIPVEYYMDEEEAEQPLYIHDDSTMEYLNESYNLRFVTVDGIEGCEQALAATPAQMNIPETEAVTGLDVYLFVLHTSPNGNTAYLLDAQEYWEDEGDIDLLATFYRASDYEDYTAIPLTAENILEYVQIQHNGFAVNHNTFVNFVSFASNFRFSFRDGLGGASYCTMDPSVQYQCYNITVVADSNSETSYSISLGEKAHTKRVNYVEDEDSGMTAYITIGPGLYGSRGGIQGDFFEISLGNKTSPEGYETILAKEAKIISTQNVMGIVFVPKNWNDSHTHNFSDYISNPQTHQGQCFCGKLGEAQSHTYEGRTCTVCGHMLASEGLEFSVGSSSCSVTGIGTCTDTDVVIPSYYQGLPVTKIAANAFRDNDKITSVFIPSTVQSIDQWAFMSCSNLESIQFSEGLQRLENLVFIWCTSLKSIEFPSTLTQTGHSLFNECTSLEYVVFPEGLTRIEHGMLTNCDSLRKVYIPASVTYIGNKAFWHSTNLTDIVYAGTMAQWEQIEKGFEMTSSGEFTSWSSDTGDFVIHCTDGDISKTKD